MGIRRWFVVEEGPMAAVLRLRCRRSEKGAAAVEFALVVIPLVLLLVGIISYGFMLSFRQAISQGTAEGARAAAVTLQEAQRQAQGASALNDAMGSYGVACNASTDSLTRASGGSTRVVGTCDVSAPYDCGVGSPQPRCIDVTVAYQYRDHPLVPSFPGIGIVMPETLEYTATARVS